MKIKIGPYKNYFGPYQLAQKLMFWIPKEKDEYGFPHTADKVHRFGEWLAYGSIEPETDTYRLENDSRSSTLLNKFLGWIDSKKKRKIDVQIHDYDTWDMAETLGFVIRPMLYQLKDEKNGAPYVDLEDCPEHLHPKSKPKDGETDEFHFDRWDWILDEMIFAFETLQGGKYEDWEEQFYSGNMDIYWKKVDEGYEMKHGPSHTQTFNREEFEQYEKRIQNGFVLFGKYYRSLWT